MSGRNQNVILRFDAKLNKKFHQKDIRDGLSVVARTGKTLWLASDEGGCLERLTETKPGVFDRHRTYLLEDYVKLKRKPGEEIDIEGIAVGGDYLWLTGSHSLKRKRPAKPGLNQKEQMGRLATIEKESARFFLARIPLVEENGEFNLKKSDGNRHAGMLRQTRHGNELLDALRDDEHFAPFMRIPGKDNGFDIEGLAVADEKIFLGLRGPVLRGWAAIIRIEMEEDGRGKLKLREIRSTGGLYTKHFINCGGLGIRELMVEGEDLLVLAGPTMVLDGAISLYRWKNGAKVTVDSIARKDALEHLLEIPRGTGKDQGRDRAEGITWYRHSARAPELLVVYDSPAPRRKREAQDYLADRILI